MARPDICETPRKAIIRAMAQARKLGYFAKFGFRQEKRPALDELEACGITEFVFALKYYADYMHAEEFVSFIWAGDGQVLVDMFRSQGLKVEWEGESQHVIRVCTKFPG